MFAASKVLPSMPLESIRCRPAATTEIPAMVPAASQGRGEPTGWGV